MAIKITIEARTGATIKKPLMALTKSIAFLRNMEYAETLCGQAF
jgi:hypothetical protein